MRKASAKAKRLRNFAAMSSLKILLLFGVVFRPTMIEGQSCQRTNVDRDSNCEKECSLSIGCNSDKRKCICDGDCGYSCVKKDFRCPKLPHPANGQRDYSRRRFNRTAKFTCNQGFFLVGSKERTCRGNEKWDGVQPVCGKKCNDPGISNNNTLRQEPMAADGFLTLQVLHYYCRRGYLIEGKNSITCQEDGTWNGHPPLCYRISCSSPKLPANSEVFRPTWFDASKGARNGRRLSLTCKPGYYRTGSFRMACLNGTWKIPTSFKCSPKICGDPGVPANGHKEGLLYHFKSRVTFHCNQCYKLVGAAYRVCNADQTWSDKQPTCEKAQNKCKKIKDSISISNGQATSSSLQPVNCGDKIKFSCNRGFNLVGSQQIVCDEDGQWSGQIPSCEPVACPPFNVSSPVRVNISENHYYLSTANFSCNANYSLSGKESLSCKENGEWSGEIPQCLAPCRVNITKNLIKVYQNGTKPGSDCKEGFGLIGIINSDWPVCFNGTWKFDGKEFYPRCESNRIIEMFDNNYWDKSYSHGG